MIVFSFSYTEEAGMFDTRDVYVRSLKIEDFIGVVEVCTTSFGFEFVDLLQSLTKPLHNVMNVDEIMAYAYLT